jgi:hypothetical protein
MKTALNWLRGKRTYVLAAVAILYIFGGDQGWWLVSDQVLALLGFGGLAALRAGIGQAKNP